MTDRLRVAADSLDVVYRGADPVEPLRHSFATADIETAYAIQEINTRRWLAEGRKITGRKIGLTSEAVQAQLGVDQPDYGMLFDDMLVANGGTVDYGDVSQARIEGEIAFSVAKRLGNPDIDLATLKRSIGYASAAFEIVGSRIRDWDIELFDTIADNASSGKYVLGNAKVPVDKVDLVGCRMTLKANGDTVSRGIGGACLGNPLNAALWLAKKMAEVDRPLEPGDVIMSGALGPFVTVAPGATYTLYIEGFDTVQVDFAKVQSNS